MPLTAVTLTVYAVSLDRPVSWQAVVAGEGCGGLLQSRTKQAPAGLVGQTSSSNFPQPPAGAVAGGVTVATAVVVVVWASFTRMEGALQAAGPGRGGACQH